MCTGLCVCVTCACRRTFVYLWIDVTRENPPSPWHMHTMTQQNTGHPARDHQTCDAGCACGMGLSVRTQDESRHALLASLAAPGLAEWFVLCVVCCGVVVCVRVFHIYSSAVSGRPSRRQQAEARLQRPETGPHRPAIPSLGLNRSRLRSGLGTRPRAARGGHKAPRPAPVQLHRTVHARRALAQLCSCQLSSGLVWCLFDCGLVVFMAVFACLVSPAYLLLLSGESPETNVHVGNNT